MNPSFIGASRSRTSGAIVRAVLALGMLVGVAVAAEPRLSLQDGVGVICRTPWAEVHLDQNDRVRGPLLRFLKDERDIRLDRPTIERANAHHLELRYQVVTPSGSELGVTRHLQLQRAKGDWALVETFELRPGTPIEQDLEIVRPFLISTSDRSSSDRGDTRWAVPLKNGWARSLDLSNSPSVAEYRLGHWIGGKETPELALPVVQLDQNRQWQAAVCADPRFSVLFTLTARDAGTSGEVRYRCAGSKVPLAGLETRSFAIWIRPAPPRAEEFGKSIDAFFQFMLPDVPAGPTWLHQVYMVGYDFLSDNGRGWEQDIGLLTSWLKPRERRHVALCLHGWYDALGSYSLDESTGRLKSQWVAMARTRKVHFTPAELSRRLRFARDRGFRVLLYFGDGLAADSGVAGYRDDWAFRDARGAKISGWQGPDTFGATYLMNPAHPEVRRRFLAYLDALLAAVGRDVDGFVWDETFHARAGQIAFQPFPAYCDRAMLDLVKELTGRVERFDSRKVFLASDCVGIMPNIPGYAMVADGLYQDTHCSPERWPDALFPNWRNAYWSCNWGPVSHFYWTRFGVEEFGAPVAISNGWEEDHGPHEWTPGEHEDFLALFRQRMARGPAHVRYLTEDPAKLLEARGPDNAPGPSDPVPRPSPDEVNWALASNGARARASSENASQDKRYPATGAIDGLAGDDGWGSGHGWASANAAKLPQWLEVEFAGPRPVSRFVVTTYQANKNSARRWGVVDYTIETWDETTAQWKAVVQEKRGRVLFTRVHVLPQPVIATKWRVVVTRVAPGAGGVARLLQVEAWGRRE